MSCTQLLMPHFSRVLFSSISFLISIIILKCYFISIKLVSTHVSDLFICLYILIIKCFHLIWISTYLCLLWVVTTFLIAILVIISYLNGNFVIIFLLVSMYLSQSFITLNYEKGLVWAKMRLCYHFNKFLQGCTQQMIFDILKVTPLCTVMKGKAK